MVVIRQSSVCKHDIHIYKILITNFHLSKVYNASRLLIVCYFPDRSVPLRLVFLAQNHIVNKNHVVLCSSTAWLTTAVASVNGILQQPVHAVLRYSDLPETTSWHYILFTIVNSLLKSYLRSWAYVYSTNLCLFVDCIIWAFKNNYTVFRKKHPLTFSSISPRVMCRFKQKLQWIYLRNGRFWPCRN